MKKLLLALAIAATCPAAAVYQISYGGPEAAFTATYAVADHPNLYTTYDGSFGGFNSVVALGTSDAARFALQSDVTYGLPYFYYAYATIGFGATQTFITFNVGDKPGPLVQDFAVFDFAASSLAPGHSETLDGTLLGVFGQPGTPVLTISNVTPEPATVTLLSAGLALLGWRRPRRVHKRG